jgi:predicted nuclease of predicted toxin-antitoxin system
MKIKLDENLPARLAGILSNLGHDVHTVPQENLSGKSDLEIWDAAQQDTRFLITQDLDFSDTRRFIPGSHFGILLVRLRSPDRQSLIARVADVFQQGDRPLGRLLRRGHGPQGEGCAKTSLNVRGNENYHSSTYKEKSPPKRSLDGAPRLFGGVLAGHGSTQPRSIPWPKGRVSVLAIQLERPESNAILLSCSAGVRPRSSGYPRWVRRRCGRCAHLRR